MIERKFIPLVVAVFVLTAGISGSATLAVLSDSETVNVQISPDGVNATVVDNATAPTEENLNETETQNTTEVTIEDVDGLVVALDPGDRTIDAGERTEYDVYVKGATEGIVSYDLTLELSDSSVASFEDFDHLSGVNTTNITDDGDRIEASAGLEEAITNMSEDDKVVLGTVTVAGDGDGMTSLEFVDEGSHELTVAKDTNDTDNLYYEVGAMEGGDLTVTSANETSTADEDA